MDPRPQQMSRRRSLHLMAAIAAAVASGLPLGGRAAAPATAMLSRRIPSSGESLPAIGLGTSQTFDIAGGGAEFDAALEVTRLFVAGGGRLVDTSPMYGDAESALGRLAARAAVADRLFYAAKVWTRGREAGIAQMRTSMQRMGVKRIDLMQVHNLIDTAVHLATLREWKGEGKLRYIGVTHYHSGAYADLERVLKSEPLDFVQLNYSLAEREAEQRLLPLAAEKGIAVLINRPFADGALFQRVRGKTLPAAAKDAGCESWAQYFLKWILGHPAVTCAIPATRNPRHIADNLAAATGAMPDAALRARMAQEFDRA
jgi:diketogulonate reductase-like aldo/keto reductase